MLRSSTLPSLILLCLAAAAGNALAQQKPADKPSEQPPKLDVIEAGSDTPAVVLPKAGTKITEKKVGGVVTEVKVKAGKSNYTMKPNQPAGNAQPGDVVSNQIRAPQWTVFEFGQAKKKQADADAANAAAAADAPPPPDTVKASARAATRPAQAPAAPAAPAR